ncbi:MAG: RdgB/HAM1 family non-canonical purine NTP pyrophosphatase [Candidatus Krumholzibacteriota bacterium]|nr:RdgB/HAM1 family non-canonical purine NTP pyrophosphatase [Candidatus Krumholzibacteriota bacterium]
MRIVIASRNRGKVQEIEHIFGELGVELVTLDDVDFFPEPDETGETFLENARIKARAAAEATGLAALADDSGIEVDALGGGPGVRSARYGGAGLDDAGRCRRLLEALADVPDEGRGARFRCVMVLQPPPGAAWSPLETEGFLHGRIARSPSGSNGFGYDPVFFVPEAGKTAAEMTAGEKNATSHRYRALVEMKYLLIDAFDLDLGG